MFRSSHTTFHRFDHYITQYGRVLPQIVRVVKGLCETSMNQPIDPGEVLIIYKVERNWKILARDTRGRELCLPRTPNWMVEMATDKSEHEYDTLASVPSRYVRVLQDIASFHLVAGDILLFTQGPPHQPKARNLHCRLVSFRARVYLNLPANLEGKFQALSNYGIVSMDQVLKEFSLPVNVRLLPVDQITTVNCSEEVALPIEKLGNIQIEREIKQDTVFAISPSKNSILTFPTTLDIFVIQCMPQQKFLSCSGIEYEHFLSAMQNDKVLQNTIEGDCVYFTSKPVKSYSFESLYFPSFRFEKNEKTALAANDNVVRETRQQELITEKSLHCPIQQQKGACEGSQPWSYSENQAPPLPPKMLTLTAAAHCQFSTKNQQIHYTESKQESEKHGDSLEMRSEQQEVQNNHLFMHRDSQENRKMETTGSIAPLASDDTTSMQSSLTGDNLSESVESVFCETQFDVNANLTVNSGIVGVKVQKGTLANCSQRKQPSCEEPCGGFSAIKTCKDLNSVTNNTDKAKGKGRKMYQYSCVSSTEQSLSDEDNETQLSPDPLVVKQNDFSQTWQDENAVTNSKARLKEHRIYKCSVSSTEQGFSDEDNNNDNCDFFDFTFHEKQDGLTSNIPQRDEKESVKTAERVLCEEKEPETNNERIRHPNGDNAKKRLFQSLTRKPKWFRQDASKPGKKEKRLVSKTKSEAMRIPPRHATSCEDLWISSPHQDDFECVGNISKYLETREKLTKALVKINRLEKEGSKAADTALENTRDSAPEREEVSSNDRKAWKKKENDKLEGSQVMAKQSTSTQEKSTPFTSSEILKEPSGSFRPFTGYNALNSSGATCHNGNPNNSRENEESEIFYGETNNGRQRMSHKIHSLGFSYDDSDLEYVLKLPNSGPQRDNLEWHSKEHTNSRDNEEPHLEESSRTQCLCSRNPGDTCVFSYELSDSAAKQELKKAILQMEWTEDEWMELTEIARGKFSNRKHATVPYVNLAFHGTDKTVVDTSGTPEGRTQRKMPPYVNIDDGRGIAGMPPHGTIDQQARQEFVNDMQRLANRSLQKPPIPTPRRGRSSV